MENLKYILGILKSKKEGFNEKYFIPKAWNVTGTGKGILYEENGEICINPYEYFSHLIENQILCYAVKDTGYLEHAGTKCKDLPFDIKKCVIYSMLARMFTAWYHTEGVLSSGTFLKTISLLPYLKSLGVDIIYLLPIFEYSSRYKKGGMGSPYAIKNIYKLDGNLHDPLLGKYTEAMLETEFRAFVEACHILGIRVMVDFVFRTVSRDNNLLVEHPDWFYWIDLKYADAFAAPVVGKKEPFAVDKNSIAILYGSKGINRYLSQFTHSPDKIDREKWLRIVKRHRETGENILDLIESEFNITTVPGFSDMVNDIQPPWTDVTFLKFYFDVHKEAEKYISGDQPPYIMQDGIRLSVFRGRQENQELREYITGVIPYYQRKFGIDGARIDMAHALSPDLNTEIIEKVKSINGNFILWSEEFDPGKSKNAKNYGYSFISGDTWAIYNIFNKPFFNKKLIADSLMRSDLPVIAALETPDTPRAALMYKDKRALSLLVFLNYFIPNSVPFINNGMEAMEIQPMNLGLGNTEEGRFVLEKNDPMYGKLAFFDAFCIHWKNKDFEWMKDILACAGRIRKSFLDIISQNENYIEQPETIKNSYITFLCYYDKRIRKGVFFIANRSEQDKVQIDIKTLIPENIGEKSLALVYAADETRGKEFLDGVRKCLEPYEFLVGSIQ